MKKHFLALLLFSCLLGTVHAQQSLFRGPQIVSPQIHSDNTVTFRLIAPTAKEVKVSGQWMPSQGFTPGSEWALSTAVTAPILFSGNSSGALNIGLSNNTSVKDSDRKSNTEPSFGDQVRESIKNRLYMPESQCASCDVLGSGIDMPGFSTGENIRYFYDRGDNWAVAYHSTFGLGVDLLTGIAAVATTELAAWRTGLSTSSNRLFWYGGVQAEAASYAAANGLTTLEMSFTGSQLNGLSYGLFESSIMKTATAPLWRFASASFAESAVGEATVLGGSYINSNSVYFSLERQILKQNGVGINPINALSLTP